MAHTHSLDHLVLYQKHASDDGYRDNLPNKGSKHPIGSGPLLRLVIAIGIASIFAAYLYSFTKDECIRKFGLLMLGTTAALGVAGVVNFVLKNLIIKKQQ